jgi:8-oxo-(d)GTP phosphatase
VVAEVPAQVEAAGGLLWRPAPGDTGVEVALVHRPKYDDWSVPKGKLMKGEHVLVGALREVAEETGIRGVPGPRLGSIHYVKDGAPKRVRYWSMRVAGGVFEPNAEVDQLMWLPPREGMVHLGPDRDRQVVAEFAEAHCATRAVVVVRHASAGDRLSWPGADDDRPLDDLGRAQAEGLVELLTAYGVDRAYSADVLRCLDTVGPFATARQIPVTSEPLLSESGAADNPDAALDRLLEIVGRPETSVVCTQRGALATVIPRAVDRLGWRGEPPALRKGALLVLHLAVDDGRLVSLDGLDPPVTSP